MESRSEVEAPALRASDIAAQRFTLGRRGYEPDEVHAYLRSLAETVSRLQGEVDWQRARSEHLERRSVQAQETAYTRLSREFTEVVHAADVAAKRVLASAEEEARSTIASVRDRTNAMVVQAQEDATSILTAARQEAAGLVREAKELRGAADRALREAETARREALTARTAAKPAYRRDQVPTPRTVSSPPAAPPAPIPAPPPARHAGPAGPPSRWKEAIWASPGSPAASRPEAPVPVQGGSPDGSAYGSPDGSPSDPAAAETLSEESEAPPAMFVSDDRFWPGEDFAVPPHEPRSSSAHLAAPPSDPSSVKPEDLDLKFDSSLFDLFEDPED